MSKKHINLDDMWVRGELNRTTEGRRALEHHERAKSTKNRNVRRFSQRTAQRLADKALASD